MIRFIRYLSGLTEFGSELLIMIVIMAVFFLGWFIAGYQYAQDIKQPKNDSNVGGITGYRAVGEFQSVLAGRC